MGYALRPGLSFCQVEGRVVFLDLPADRYFCLGENAAATFTSIIGHDVPHQESQAEALVTSGLLSLTSDDARPVACHAPEIAGSLRGAAPAGLAEIAGAMSCRLGAQLSLRYRGLESALTTLARHKSRTMLVADVPTARAAGSAFAATALWYNRTARCLSVSVATMHWLIARGCAATLVMGVKLHPFQAHCWVQVEGNLVNDDVDSVRPFVPIVVV